MNLNEAPATETVFDEHGNTVGTVTAPSAPEPESPAPEDPPATEPQKYRIGDREFATADEAVAYARTQVSTLETEKQIAAAYRQGITDAVTHPGAQPGVTPPAAPPAPAETDAEFYSNPTEYLRKREEAIRTQVQQQVEQRIQQRSAGDQAWRDFTDRHPQLAEFRTDVESYVNGNFQEIKAISATKGVQAAYDYVAVKIKTEFARRGDAVKPKRELSNVGNVTPPASQPATVTPAAAGKKPMTFTEQIKNMNARKRRLS